MYRIGGTDRWTAVSIHDTLTYQLLRNSYDELVYWCNGQLSVLRRKCLTACWGRATNLYEMPHPIDLFVYWIQWGSFWRKWFYKDYRVTWSARTVSRKTNLTFGKAGPQLTPCRQWWTLSLKQEEELVSVRDAGTSIIGFADGALVVCAADDVRILELRINESLWRSKRWLDSRCLKMTPEKIEALLVTDRRSFKYPKQLDRRLSFGEHLQIATAKAIQCGATLTWLMPNIGGPREAKRRLVASVVNSKLLYAAPIWTSALNNHAIQKKLFSAQRGVVLRIASAYRTVSTSAVLVLANVKK